MPYIKKTDVVNKPSQDYPGFQHLTLRQLGIVARNAGDLNYLFTQIIADFMTIYRGPDGAVCNYQTMNDVAGALQGAYAEFYRRVVAPYEDQKISQANNPVGSENNRPIDPLVSVAAWARGSIEAPSFI